LYICGLCLKIIVHLNDLHMQLKYFDSYIFVCKQSNIMYSLSIHITAFSKYIEHAQLLPLGI
jgi:hypothetical protein